MATVKPFKAIRPPKEIIEELACLPYDVMNSQEAAQMAKGKEKSLLHITRAEIDLDSNIDIHSEEVYNKSKENFQMFIDKGWLKKEEEAKYYIYAQTMEGRTQYGIVASAAVDDYLNNTIKKHELTRKEKEDDRMIHVKINDANIEPVFLTYPAVTEIDQIVDSVVNGKPAEYDFVAEDGFGHHFWVIDNKAQIEELEELFKTKVPFTYVADGHHRSAAAARVGLEKREQNPNHTGEEEYNYFLAVHFPDNQLKIIDYNRVVKDLNGLTEEQFMAKIEKNFVVENKGFQVYKPAKLHEFSMYMNKNWYKLTAKEGTYTNDPIGALDVTVLSNLVLDEVLGIKDLRTSNRIDFVGGIRGLEELSRRVDSGEMKVAFALFEVSMQELINIADTGNIMPPKTTWFEPKLRSGLAIHSLED